MTRLHTLPDAAVALGVREHAVRRLVRAGAVVPTAEARGYPLFDAAGLAALRTALAAAGHLSADPGSDPEPEPVAAGPAPSAPARSPPCRSP